MANKWTRTAAFRFFNTEPATQTGVGRLAPQMAGRSRSPFGDTNLRGRRARWPMLVEAWVLGIMATAAGFFFWKTCCGRSRIARASQGDRRRSGESPPFMNLNELDHE